MGVGFQNNEIRELDSLLRRPNMRAAPEGADAWLEIPSEPKELVKTVNSLARTKGLSFVFRVPILDPFHPFHPW